MKTRRHRTRTIWMLATALAGLILLETAWDWPRAAGAQDPTADAPSAEPADEAPNDSPDPGAADDAPVRRYGDRVSVFSDTVHVPAGTVQMGDVVCIGADAVIDGEVRNVVIIGGSLTLRGRVRDQVVGVLSDLELEDAEVGGQLLNVAGSMQRRDSYVGGPLLNFSVGDWLGRFPSPFGVIGGVMFWRLLLKLFLAFVVVLMLTSLAPERIRLIGDEAPLRYLAAVFVGLVTYLAVALLLLLALLTVFGFPIALLLLRVLKWLGIAGIFLALGRRTGHALGREMSLLGAVLLAFALFAGIALSPYFAGFAGAPWWLVLPWHSLVFFGIWVFLEAPALGLVILTRGGSRSSDAGHPGGPPAFSPHASAAGPAQASAAESPARD